MRRSASSFAITRLAAAIALALLPGASLAGPTPPDMSVCEGVDACEAPKSACDAEGFKIELTGYTAASSSTNGFASYEYKVCEPAAGTCSDDATKSCLSNSQCWTNRCQSGGPHAGTCSQDDTTSCTADKDCNTATCSRECAVDTFRGLSHYDVVFPELGGVGSCLSANTEVKVSCNANGVDYAGTVGDGSCFGPTSPVAKCDVDLSAGQCLTMTLQIAGELNKPGLGAAVVVDKDATTCESSCMAGPSCESCAEPPPGDQCLTRTIGFWGNHPWITNDYAPVTVCGDTLGCSGASDGVSNPTCKANSCDSVIEGLCSNPAEIKNTAYVSMVRQLTAAKLNLKASQALFGSTCSSWTLGGKTIQQWIASCESLCESSKAAISNSGCIEALDAFNRSEDEVTDTTPAPFDRPSVDDFGNVSGADPSQCGLAQGNNGSKSVLVIDENAPKGASCEAD